MRFKTSICWQITADDNVTFKNIKDFLAKVTINGNKAEHKAKNTLYKYELTNGGVHPSGEQIIAKAKSSNNIYK